MDDKDGTDDHFEGMSEIEKIENERALLDEAVNNSYDIVTKKTTLADLLLAREDGEYTAIAHDMDDGYTNDDIEIFITYFEDKEEYEKCLVLQKILKNDK
tara:strand:- start:2389 stop:2688 length:300 start_codon:yes stop_codon:yes gene_type:complete